MIDFDKLFDEEEQINNKLFAVIFGASGGGKSYICGSLKGRTLFLNVKLEKHGVTSARTCAARMQNGAKIVGLDIDEEERSPDDSFNFILEMLSKVEKRKDIDNVVLDSFNMIETSIIRRSQRFLKECRSEKGVHNSFQETPVVSGMFYEIITALHRVNSSGKNVIATCALDITALNDDGSIMSARPDLSTFGVAQTIARHFSTVLVVGRTVEEHLLQFKADIKRESKDSLKRVLKTANFSPRVQGLSLDQLPDSCKPDLNRLIEVINGKHKINGDE